MAQFDASELIRWEDAFDSAFRTHLLNFAGAAFKIHGRKVRRTLVLERLSGRPGLKRQTGDLARSVDSVVSGSTLSSLSLTITIGRGQKQAAKQEKGGVIRGKPWLLIPLDSVRTRTGAPKFRNGFDPRLRPTFILTAGGKSFVAKTFKRKSDIKKTLGSVKRLIQLGGTNTVLLFKLQRSVFLPPRLGARDIWFRADTIEDRSRLVQGAIQRALKRAGIA